MKVFVDKWCKYCKTKLTVFEVKHGYMGSPFNKTAPVYLCKVCDAPGRMPKH